MLKITDFADRGGVDRLVYFVEEIWGTLHPDCGPNDLQAIEEEAAVVIAERDRLRRELEEAKAELARFGTATFEVVSCDGCAFIGNTEHEGQTCRLCGGKATKKIYARESEHSLMAFSNAADRYRAELVRMRPVVEAAKDFCQEHHPGCSWDCPHPSPQCRFNRAVVAYFGQDAVYPPPEEDE